MNDVELLTEKQQLISFAFSYSTLPDTIDYDKFEETGVFNNKLSLSVPAYGKALKAEKIQC